MKPHVDEDLCIGCAACEDLCPEVFRIEDDGLSHVIMPEPPRRHVRLRPRRGGRVPDRRDLDRRMSPLPPDYRIPETDEALLAECDVQVFRATGPGGQSVNTTDSAVRLTHRPSGFVVVARRERSQLRNKGDALKRLRVKLVDAQRVRPKRVARPSRRAERCSGGSTAKSQLSAKKATRRSKPED